MVGCPLAKLGKCTSALRHGITSRASNGGLSFSHAAGSIELLSRVNPVRAWLTSPISLVPTFFAWGIGQILPVSSLTAALLPLLNRELIRSVELDFRRSVQVCVDFLGRNRSIS